jgi:hypothetical protein
MYIDSHSSWTDTIKRLHELQDDKRVSRAEAITGWMKTSTGKDDPRRVPRLQRIFLEVFANTWTHKPRELISREYVRGTTHAESQETMLAWIINWILNTWTNITLSLSWLISNYKRQVLNADANYAEYMKTENRQTSSLKCIFCDMRPTPHITLYELSGPCARCNGCRWWCFSSSNISVWTSSTLIHLVQWCENRGSAGWQCTVPYSYVCRWTWNLMDKSDCTLNGPRLAPRDNNVWFKGSFSQESSTPD